MLAHPYADKFPMLPQVELEELAESIRENGLRQPVVVTPDGLILDGRNRAAACELIGIEPETVVYDGDDLAEYVIDCNVSRRHMNHSQRAMATALVLFEDGRRRDDGRFEYGSLGNPNPGSDSWATLVRRAGVVLDWTPAAAEKVISGELPLKVAYAEACEARDRVDAEKRVKAIEANRKREATIKEREENDRKLAALTTEKSRFLANIQDGSMTIAVAYAAHQEETRKERQKQEEIARGWRDTCTRIAECVRFLDGGEERGEVFLREFYPHESEYLADGMRLTRARIQSATEFLEAIKKGVTR